MKEKQFKSFIKDDPESSSDDKSEAVFKENLF